MKNLLLMILCSGFALTLVAQDTVTVMTYNILNFPSANNTDPDGSNAARVVHFRTVIETANADIIILQELKSNTGANMLLTELNTNGVLGKTYNKAPSFTDYSGLGNMLLYNDDLIDFAGQTEIPLANSMVDPDGDVIFAPRAASHYSLIIKDPTCFVNETQLEVISGHLKAANANASATTLADRDRRLLGALDITDYMATLPANSNIIVGGDFNFVDDSAVSEPGYAEFLDATNTIPLFDPVGPWTRNDAADVCLFTQSTRSISSQFGNGGASGGFDDRFDFWLTNSNVNTGAEMVTLIPGTYETYGNTKVLNGDATAGTFPYEDAILKMSDHYPVVMNMEVTYQNAVCPSCVAVNGVCSMQINN